MQNTHHNSFPPSYILKKCCKISSLFSSIVVKDKCNIKEILTRGVDAIKMEININFVSNKKKYIVSSTRCKYSLVNGFTEQT